MCSYSRFGHQHVFSKLSSIVKTYKPEGEVTSRNIPACVNTPFMPMMKYASTEIRKTLSAFDHPITDSQHLIQILGKAPAAPLPRACLPLAQGEQVCSIREALFAPHEVISADQSLGRICGAPTVACPPAIPIAVSGERIGKDALALFAHYGVTTVDVLR